MSKSAEAATKAYPKEYGKVWHSAFGTFEFDKNAPERIAYQQGYEQAEKDLALTWEDVAVLITIYEQEVEAGNICRYEDEGAPSLQDASEIILRRFYEQRKK